MAKQHKLFLLMYDITDKKAVQKTAKIIQQHGYIRINLSVWIGNTNPLRDPILKDKLSKLLGSEKALGSLLYVIPVFRQNINKIRTITGERPKELDYWIGNQHSMFF